MAFDSLNKREKILIALTMIAVISVLLYLYLYTPLVESVADTEANIEEMENDVIISRAEAEEKRRLEKEYELLLEQTGQMTEEEFFPESKEFELIKHLNTLADDIGLDLFSIEAQDLIPSETLFFEIPLAVHVEGSYTDLINYLGEIEHSQYAIRIASLSLNSDFVASRDDEEQIEARLDIIGYGQEEVGSR